MKKILKDKTESRKRLAALSFEEKLSIMEQLRDRAMAIAQSPLRKQQETRRNALKPMQRNAA